MAELTRPNFTHIWASNGTLTPPSNTKIDQGWVAEIPPLQFENYIQNRQDVAIAYLFQRGVAEWDASTEYFANKSVVIYGGVLYMSLTNNINIPPSPSANWKEMIPSNTAFKMGTKVVSLPYTLTAADKFYWLQLVGSGNLFVPSGVFAPADWVIVSKNTSSTGPTVVGGGATVAAQYGKNLTLPGPNARASLVFTTPSYAEASGDFQYV